MPIHFDEEKQKRKLELLYHKEEEDLAKILSEKYGVSYIDLTKISIDTDGLRLIPEEAARKAKIAVFDLVGKKMRIAVLSPRRDDTKGIIKDLENRGYIVETFIVSTQSLERAWERYKDISFAKEAKAGTLDISSDEVAELMGQIKTIDDIKNLVGEVMGMKKAFRVSRIVETVLAGAIATGASDVHVEPEEASVRLRFRLDGILVPITTFDQETYKLLLSRIKLLSGMKLNVKTTAQDGRFSIIIAENEIEVRSSVLPGNYGESIVMRLLNPESIQVPIEDLGVSEKLMKVFMEEIDKPNGMILNTGPTGSGKTTTLYSFMRKKKTPGIKIITIEDPIEYHLKGVVQTQVDAKKGYDFANGLKHSLRQDPDVIMVGEIRDLETAETAVHAALTGHLVFSTLHTNNAAGTFPRLIDLGVNPKILTSAINLSIAQRLVRRLCPKCKKEIPLEGEKKELLKKIYDTIKEPLVEFKDVIYEAVGCGDCQDGYKGRIGIFEAIKSTKAIEEILQGNPSESEIKKAAEAEGIMDMAQDGVTKILQGMTTIEEAERVVDLHNRSGKGDGLDNVSPEVSEELSKIGTDVNEDLNFEDFVKST